MNPRNTDRQAGGAPAAAKKHTYGTPRLKEFGQLHLQTQGTGANGSDGGSIMTMAPSMG